MNIVRRSTCFPNHAIRRDSVIAGVIDELTLDIAPVLLGSGERIFDGVQSLGLEPVEALRTATSHLARSGLDGAGRSRSAWSQVSWSSMAPS